MVDSNSNTNDTSNTNTPNLATLGMMSDTIPLIAVPITSNNYLASLAYGSLTYDSTKLLPETTDNYSIPAHCDKPTASHVEEQIANWFATNRPDMSEYRIEELPADLAKAWDCHVFGLFASRKMIGQLAHKPIVEYPVLAASGKGLARGLARDKVSIKRDTATNDNPLPEITTNLGSITSHGTGSKHSITYCKYSGVMLSCVPTMFVNEKAIHFGNHWLFDQNINALFKYHYDNKNKTHEMRSLLILAMLTNSQVLGNKIKVKHPIIFNETKLTRNYGQMVIIANKLRGLTPERRNNFIKGLPKFTTDSYHHDGLTQAGCYLSGSNLIEWVCSAVLPALLEKTDTVISYAELEVQSELMKLELSSQVSKAKQKYQLVPTNELPTNSNQYWDYILADIEQSFDLPSKAVDGYRDQIAKPTDLAILTELQTLLKGLLESTKIDEELTVPSLQFKYALAEVSEKMKNIVKPAKLQLLVDTVIVTSVNENEDGSSTVVNRTQSAKPTTSTSHSGRTLAQLMADRHKRVEDSSTRAADFVIKYQKKLVDKSDK